MSSLQGKVAFISGAARGQGRSHAITLAAQGADIIAFDICAPVDSVAAAGATEADLAETARQVEALDRRIVTRIADVRDQRAVQDVLEAGVAELGRVDIVLANAGIMGIIGEQAQARSAWHEAIDIMLTGVLHTCEAAIPRLIAQGDGGAIVITSSVAGLKAPVRTVEVKSDGLLGYVAAKHGVVGLMRAYANALGPYGIRCNTIHPGGVATPMVANEEFARYAAERTELMAALEPALPVPMLDAVDISNAVLYLCSDAGRFVTGITMPVDAGSTVR